MLGVAEHVALELPDERQVAAKTGTVQIGGQANDAWTTGFTPELLATSVWIGTDATTPSAWRGHPDHR